MPSGKILPSVLVALKAENCSQHTSRAHASLSLICTRSPPLTIRTLFDYLCATYLTEHELGTFDIYGILSNAPQIPIRFLNVIAMLVVLSSIMTFMFLGVDDGLQFD